MLYAGCLNSSYSDHVLNNYLLYRMKTVNTCNVKARENIQFLLLRQEIHRRSEHTAQSYGKTLVLNYSVLHSKLLKWGCLKQVSLYNGMNGKVSQPATDSDTYSLCR
jgi:hypothetical protein